MVQQRAQVQQVVYYEQVDIVYKPLSLDETVRKIRHALRHRNNCARRRKSSAA